MDWVERATKDLPTILRECYPKAIRKARPMALVELLEYFEARAEMHHDLSKHAAQGLADSRESVAEAYLNAARCLERALLSGKGT